LNQPPKKRNRQRIQSLDRGLRLLEYVSERQEPVSLASMASLLGVDKSSAYRLVSTLADRGYVRQQGEVRSSGYVIGNKIFSLARKMASQRTLQDHARKFLRELARSTGETAHLAVRGETGAALVDHELGHHTLAVTTGWGSEEPYHCTALGKALLVNVDPNELADRLGPCPYQRFTDRTVLTLGQLQEELRSLKETLVAYDRGEYREETCCIASPVWDFRREAVAAIGISGPSSRMNKTTLSRNAEQVRCSALALSEELGFTE